ncbi:hypothetical protein [Embleya scabrispora]|uniref:hypothetical protein n=1 Tax=Embleya scabrispora TaxID=159449 RepID=UPI0003AA59D4|nr:hypothetical protein [Embleya scabrispora]MYS83294.1 hypothetical protein [Streptomyces sp. SID5474]
MYGTGRAVVRAIGPVLGILLLAGCADDGDDPFAVGPNASPTGAAPVAKGPGPTPTTTRPAGTSAPPSRTPEQAQALAASLALTPEDWGTGFVRQSTYEFAGETWTDYAADCTQQSVPLPASILGQWVRQVQMPETAQASVLSSGSTTVIVHKDVRGAREQVQNAHQVKDRCPTRTYSDGTRAKDTPGAAQPTFAEADEVFAEEGLMHPKGGGEPYPYVVLTVRKDTVVMSSYFSAPTADRVPDVRTRGNQAARLMLDRLVRR